MSTRVEKEAYSISREHREDFKSELSDYYRS
jgi:hypothetical protein